MNDINKINKLKLKSKIQFYKIPQVDAAAPQNAYENTGNKRLHSERAGDWVCIACNNLNFSFRKVCNRCKYSIELNEYGIGQRSINL